MPRWIYNRPPDKCQETELRFARFLNEELSDDWIVRWGYWYEDDRGTLREGDFLVLGPTGGLAVFEVKSSVPQPVASGARWDTGDGDNPVAQLLAEHAGVIRRVTGAAAGRKAPWVSKALVFPAVEIAPNVTEHRGIPRHLMIAGNDLRDFGRVWRHLFAENRNVTKEQREVFLEAYGDGIAPKNVQAFISETDKILLQQATANYRLLDMLAGNLQLVVEGGVGTGKSWHALEQAKRLAENAGGASGRDVLLVAYNLALCERLRVMAGRMRLPRGSITVEGSESLAAAILSRCGIRHEIPPDREAAQRYFGEELPSLALAALDAEPDKLGDLAGRYDALVVDEAQDHDTTLSGRSDGDEVCGWWSIYVRLLKDGWSSSMALFGDVAQRPPFRSPDRFSLEAVRKRLTQHAHVRLDRVLRYTRPVYLFLRGLEAEGTRELVAGLRSTGPLLDGPDVIRRRGSAADLPRLVEQVLEEWETSGLCPPTKVLILYERSSIDRSVLAGLQALRGHPLRPYLEIVDQPNPRSIGHSSVHKAKGLDSLAVILAGLPPFENLTRSQDRYTYFMGASRARQLLACVDALQAP